MAIINHETQYSISKHTIIKVIVFRTFLPVLLNHIIQKLWLLKFTIYRRNVYKGEEFD